MTKHEKRIAEFAIFSDEQLQTAADLLLEQSSAMQAREARIRRELARRRKEARRLETCKCGGGK